MERIKVYSLLLCFLAMSCKSSNLILDANLNDTERLKLHGFYWVEAPVDHDESWFLLNSLYRDGTLLQFGGVKGETSLKNKRYVEAYIAQSADYISRQNRTDWGRYVINGNEIQFEKWEPSSGGRLKTVLRKGELLSDTAFVITEKINHYDGKTYHVKDTFRFREFSPKPDSTNRFIK